jgi:hypothetical protein
MVAPSVPCTLVTPLSPHSLSFRPLIIPGAAHAAALKTLFMHGCGYVLGLPWLLPSITPPHTPLFQV